MIKTAPLNSVAGLTSERLFFYSFFRKHTMSNRDLWNCDTNNMDQMVCVLSKTHNLWLRAFIEKQLSEKEVNKRYIPF